MSVSEIYKEPVAAGIDATCAYCVEQKGAYVINGEWLACATCAEKVERGAQDAGYEVYCEITGLNSNGIYHCPECHSSLDRCECIVAEVEARRLPLVPPTRGG